LGQIKECHVENEKFADTDIRVQRVIGGQLWKLPNGERGGNRQ